MAHGDNSVYIGLSRESNKTKSGAFNLCWGYLNIIRYLH